MGSRIEKIFNQKIKLILSTKLNCKNLLITGGAGFIGSNFINLILNKYEDVNVYNIDLLTYAGNLNNTKQFEKNSRYKFIQGDICDTKLLERIFNKYKIDSVINFAAESHVDNSIINPEIFIRTNVLGVFSLLNVCYKTWMTANFKHKNKFKNARFYQISTDEVYGSINNGSFDENQNCMPNSPYSSSKASADMITRSFNKTYGINTIISRCSNNYGKNQHKEKLIPKIIYSLKNEKSFKFYGDGLNVRDWICVTDHCEAIDLIFKNGVSGEIYNIGANNELTNIDVFYAIYNLIRPKKSADKFIKFINDRPGHDRRYSLNIEKIKSNLNWEPKYKFEEEIKKLALEE